MKSKQLSFDTASSDFNRYWKQTKRKFHGGKFSEGKRKTKRPLDTKKPIHIVLSSSKAKGNWSFRSPLHRDKVNNIVHTYAARFGVKIYDYSNNSNHLHLQVKIERIDGFKKYLKAIAGLIAREIMKAKKGEPKGKFWDTTIFTRVADWGRGFGNLRKYIYRNVLEASGVIPYDRENIKFRPIESTA